MKITKRQLKRIIKEEKVRLMTEITTHSRKSLEVELTAIADRLSEIAGDIDEGKHAYEEYEAQGLHNDLHQASSDLYDILEAYGV